MPRPTWQERASEEAAQRRANAFAGRVSRVLKEGGLERASAYRTFGREREGFAVFPASKYGRNSGGAVVAFTRRNASVECDRAVEILTAAGYVATPHPRNGLGGDYRIDVTKAQA